MKMDKMKHTSTTSINIMDRRQNDDSDSDSSCVSSSSTLKRLSIQDNNVVNLCDSDNESENNDEAEDIIEEEMQMDEEEEADYDEVGVVNDDEDEEEEEDEEVGQTRNERQRRDDVWYPKSIDEIEQATQIYPELRHLSKKDRVNIENFTIIQVLGTGAYGKVFLVRKNDGVDEGTLYAMKVLKKISVISKKKTAEHTKTERQVLEKVRHKPFLAGMHYAFTDDCHLYIVLDYVCGGELFTHLYHNEKFPEKDLRIYIAELVIALEQLHEIGVVYRDIKLENVLIDKDGHIVLTDFGLSRQLAPSERATSYCGTMEYMAPEIVKGELYRGHDFLADWWSVGVLLVELLTGASPFAISDGAKQEEIVKRILEEDPQISLTPSEPCLDLIKRLLDKNPNTRIASGKTKSNEIKKHPFFKDINWKKLINKQYTPAIQPKIENDLDTQNFSEEFTSLPVENSPGPIPENTKYFFRGFSYTGSEFRSPDEVIDELDSKEDISIEEAEVEDHISDEKRYLISLIPEISEKYQITKTKINSGSFANCYKAFFFEKNENCAAKAISYRNYQPDEVECLRKLNHNNIVKFYDVVKISSSSFIYLVMEYLEGGELYDYVRNSPLERLTEDVSKNIVRQIASAIEYMHENNYLHRDIKPENIMFTDDKYECVKLIDFGFSSYIKDGKPFTSDPRFTLDYAPPEIIRANNHNNNSLYCKGNDIWSLGTVIYTMVVGHPPFRHKEGENDEETVRERIIICDYDRNETWMELSSLVRDLILRTFELDHENRLSASDILLHDWLNHESSVYNPEAQEVYESPLAQEWDAESSISAGDLASVISMEDEDEVVEVEVAVDLDPEEIELIPTEPLSVSDDVQSAEENNNMKNEGKSEEGENNSNILETDSDEEDWFNFDEVDPMERAKIIERFVFDNGDETSANPRMAKIKKILRPATKSLSRNHSVPIKKRYNYRKSPDQPIEPVPIQAKLNDVENVDLFGFESNTFLMQFTLKELLSEHENCLGRKTGKARLHFTDFKSNVPVNINNVKIRKLVKPKSKNIATTKKQIKTKISINSNSSAGSRAPRNRRMEVDLKPTLSSRKPRGTQTSKSAEPPLPSDKQKRPTVKRRAEIDVDPRITLSPRKTRYSAGKRGNNQKTLSEQNDSSFVSIKQSDKKKIALVKPLKAGRKRKTVEDPGFSKKKLSLRSPNTTKESFTDVEKCSIIVDKVTY